MLSVALCSVAVKLDTQSDRCHIPAQNKQVLIFKLSLLVSARLREANVETTSMKTPVSLCLSCIALTIMFLMFSGQAIAGGLYLSELGTPGNTGTAGVANPTNTFTADAAWTNPAGMTGLEHDEVLTGLQFVVPWVEFDPSVAEAGGSDGGNAGIFTVAPSLFVVKKLTERARLGFSVAGLLGGGGDYGSDFVGRFSVIIS